MPAFKGGLYKFLEGKQCEKTNTQGVVSIVPYKPTRAKVNDIIDALNTWCPVEKDPPTWLDHEDHPYPSNLIIFKNGMLDVNEYVRGNIVMHNPDPRLFTYNVFPYDFDEDVWSNLYEDTYNQIFNEDAECIRTLMQWLGYNLVPDMTLEKLMLFIGDTRSGKSTILETLHGMLGRNQYNATSFQALANTHGLYSLIGKLAATLGDARTPRRGEADTALQTILQISGGDPVTVNPKYIQPFDIHLTCRFTVAMNNLPGFSDPAKAFVARAIVLNFPNSYVGREDFTLKERLKKEAREGKLINFALQGLKDLRKQGKFTMPVTSESLLRQLEEITAPVTAFVGECCDKIPGAYIARDQLFEAWQIWCSKSGHNAGNKNYFGRWFNQACPGIESFRPTIDGRRQYAYCGITLSDWVYLAYLGRSKS
jgi:putative DNA primase/helicase